MQRRICALMLIVVWALAAQGSDDREITGNGVRLRSGPSTDSAILHGMSKGTAVRVLEVLPDKPWAKVRLTATGQEGWVHTDFVSAPPAPVSPSALEPAPALEPVPAPEPAPEVEPVPEPAPEPVPMLEPIAPPTARVEPDTFAPPSAPPAGEAPPVSPGPGGGGRIVFADVSHWDAAGWELMDDLAPNMPVRFITAGQTVIYTGNTREQGVYENLCAGLTVQTTRVALDPGQGITADPILGISGGGELAALSLREVRDPGRVASYTRLVDASSAARSGLAERGTPTAVRAYEVENDLVKAALVVYEYTRDLGGYIVTERCFAFTAGQQVRFLNAGCPGLPEFFRLGTTVYSVFTFGECESDDYNKLVLEVGASGIHDAYYSNAFGC